MEEVTINCWLCGKPAAKYTEQRLAEIVEDLGLDSDDELGDCCDACAKANGFPYSEPATVIPFKPSNAEVNGGRLADRPSEAV